MSSVLVLLMLIFLDLKSANMNQHNISHYGESFVCSHASFDAHTFGHIVESNQGGPLDHSTRFGVVYVVFFHLNLAVVCIHVNQNNKTLLLLIKFKFVRVNRRLLS